MDATVVIPAVTALLAGAFALLLVDQWRDRRRGYQLIWAMGMACYAVAVGCEAIAAATGWSQPIYAAWYLTGAVWTAGWLGLGTAFLLGRTRFGLAFALCLFLAGLFTFLTARRDPAIYADASTVAMLYFLVAGVLALAIAVETYFQNWRWPWMALSAVGGATLLSIVLMAAADAAGAGLRRGSRDRRAHGRHPAAPAPAADALPQRHRCLLAHPGGALLDLRLHAQATRPGLLARPGQPGDQFLFNLLIAPVAISVNFVASLPGARRRRSSQATSTAECQPRCSSRWAPSSRR